MLNNIINFIIIVNFD